MPLVSCNTGLHVSFKEARYAINDRFFSDHYECKGKTTDLIFCPANKRLSNNIILMSGCEPKRTIVEGTDSQTLHYQQ